MRAPDNTMRLWLQGAMAGATVATASCLQLLLRDVFHIHRPYPFYFLAVMGSAWVGGRVAAGVSVALGALASTALLMQPHDGNVGSTLELVGSLVLYLAVSGVAAYSIVALRLARDRAAANVRLARESLEALRREQDRTAATLGSISDGVIRVDHSGCIAYLNPIASRLAGVAEAGALGRRFSEVVRLSSESGGSLQSIAFDVIRESTNLSAWLVSADGSRVAVEISGSCVAGQGGDSVVTIRDLTERQRAEKLQQETEHRFRVLADSAPVLIWMTTPSKQFDYFNRPWLEFTGLDAVEATPDEWASYLHPHDRARCLRAFHDCCDARKPFRLEYRLRRHDGEYRWVFDTGVSRSSPAGEFLGYIGSAVDVTDRKNAEERFQTVVETANEGVWMVAADRRILYANERMARMLGCPVEELRGRAVLDFCFPESHEAAQERIDANLGGQVECYDFRFRRASGDEVLVLASTGPVRDAEGKVVAAVGMFSDVTERRRAVAALRESEERFRQLAENIDDVFWIYDLAQGRNVYVSPAYEALWGRSRDVLIFHPGDWSDAVHPQDRDCMNELLERRSRGEAFDEQYRIVHPDGSLRWIRDRGYPVAERSGRVYRMIGIAEDITSRKQAETSLRESEAKLRALLESASQGVVAVDENGRVLLVNAKTEELFGYQRSELIGQQLEILLPAKLTGVHEQHRSDYFARPRTRPMGRGLYLAGKKKNGEEFPLEISLSYLAESGVRMALALITDITERQRFDEKLRETAKLESLGVLAGGIAHDFNNILTGILGNASLALELSSGPDDLRPLLESVVDASERAAHLTRQMLAYSGKGRFIVEAVDISAALRKTVELLQSSIPRSVELHLDLAPALPSIEADVAQFQQIAMNLVINAAEAISGRAGVVTVRTGMTAVPPPGISGNIAGNDVAAGNYVTLEVRDNGSGMDAETRARMFDPFFTTKFTGRGLGLAATLGIVRGHQGAILVDTEEGQGTAVTVLFPPAADRKLQADAKPSPIGIPDRATILVVDDEEVVRNAAGAALERAGHTVLFAENGHDAVKVFSSARDRIGLVLLDMTMPVMGGEETLGRLREIDGSVTVVLSSGYSEMEVLDQFAGQGVAGFLQKPYTASRLLEQVDRVLAGESKQLPDRPLPRGRAPESPAP